ncbi:serine hydrolase [Legionella sp. W05-934-2]|uniref:serine hydrolase n=1 Tax=Legionella TaxID=445 RepID=UPI0034627B7F
MNKQVLRMEQVVQTYVADKQFMGSILVAQHGHIILDKGYGYANLEWQIPNTTTTKFRIASLTKQFTAVAILLLEEQGKLKISDFTNKYMPNAPSAWDKVTLFHLLNHTSGIPSYTSFPDFAAFTTSTKTPEQQIEFFRNKPLNFQPGSNFEYNNSAYVLLGYLIEKISGQSYQDFVVNNIFKPLEMNDSGYDSHSEIILHRAAGYMVSSNGIRNADYLDMSIPYSAGSLYSTTHDLLRWEQSLFGGKILSIESLKKMIEPFKNDYGLGVRIYSLNGHKVISHAGGTSGFNTKLIYFPDDKLTVIVLANLNALGYVAQDLALKLVGLAHGRSVTLPSERKEIVLSSESLAKYIGTYNIKPYVGTYGLTRLRQLIISLQNGYLMVQETGQPNMKLFPESETKFFGKIPDIQINFFKNESGQVSHLVLHQDGENSTGLKDRT